MSEEQKRKIPVITAVMIVKNENHIIKDALHSIRNVADSWVIVDHGSTDGTIETLEELSKDSEFPGALFHNGFENFSQARNYALTLGRTIFDPDWIITIDADMILEKPEILRKEIIDCRLNRGDIDGILVKNYDFDEVNWQVRAFRRDRNWEYKYRTHEILTKHDTDPVVLESNSNVRHFGTGGSRVGKFERDEKLLKEDISEMPNDPVLRYYLGDTLRELEKFNKAIHQFRKVVALDEENGQLSYCSTLKIASIFERMKQYDGVILTEYLEAASMRPGRFEARLGVYRILNQEKKFNTVIELEELFNQDNTGSTDKMLVDERSRTLSRIELAKSYYSLYDKNNFLRIKKELLKDPLLTDSEYKMIRKWV